MSKEINNLTPEEANKVLNDSDCILIDVRTPAEFNFTRAKSAINIPLQSLSSTIIDKYKDKRILCICQKGSRGAQAAKILTELGIASVYNITGGTDAWEKSGLPVIKDKNAISLERQVRIAAGSLVVAGIIGSYLFSPYLLFLSLFVGSGLIYSGITDTCGMAMILARCPWNNKS